MRLLKHYEVLESLAEGGMGQVYRARDTLLDRTVAIKLLPTEFATDRERLARLEREAKLLATLNHPNIATIHGLELDGETRFLVLELIPGESLAERISRGPLPMQAALELARQIAEGLAAAHDAGIVHRDLKPANVVVTPDGRAKVVDFGIAKEASATARGASDATALTMAGTLTGTPAYMSPEQVRGEVLDRRADNWAFGCLVYEMLTRRSPFARETVADTLAAVVEHDPDLTAIPADVPPAVRRLIRRCLHKDPTRRLRDIGDAWIEIDESLVIGEATGLADSTATVEPPPRASRARAVSSRMQLLSAGMILVFAMVLGIAWVWRPSPSDAAATTRSFIDIGAGLRLGWGSGGAVRSRPIRHAITLSPGGERMVYAATRDGVTALYRQDFDKWDPVPIPGTEDGYNPVFSPDGRYIVYATRARAIPGSQGGAPVADLRRTTPDGDEDRLICRCLWPASFGVSWADDDSIFFAGRELGGLMKVDAGGGEPTSITKPDTSRGEISHRLPHVLPGSKAVLFTIVVGPDERDAKVAVHDLETGNKAILIEDGMDGRYLDTGHLLFARRGALLAVRFDPVSLQVSGAPTVVVEDVQQAIMAVPQWTSSGAAQFAVARNGTLAYATGGVHPEPAHWLEIVGLEGAGRLPIAGRAGEVEPRGFVHPRFSPDQTQIAYARIHGESSQIWLFDIGRRLTRPLAVAGFINNTPVWSPDGLRIAFVGDADTGTAIFKMNIDGSNRPVQLLSREGVPYLSSWSEDGTIAFAEAGPDSGFRSFLYHPEQGLREVPGDPLYEMYPSLSADSDWLLLEVAASHEGEPGIFVAPTTSLETREFITNGTRPMWGPGWKSIYFQRDGAVMEVDVSLGSRIAVGEERAVYEGDFVGSHPVRSYDVGADAQLLMVTRAEVPALPVTRIRLVRGWFEELRQRVPVNR